MIDYSKSLREILLTVWRSDFLPFTGAKSAIADATFRRKVAYPLSNLSAKDCLPFE
ncbi:MAG: hypothetical protein LBC02_13140 [Planctomycetaceae bacterium]|nr:hypothetical protein [Planctomycetaceae bacterium]